MKIEELTVKKKFLIKNIELKSDPDNDNFVILYNQSEWGGWIDFAVAEKIHNLNSEKNEYSLYLKGFIKWDGCCEFGTDGKDIHFCGSGHIGRHAEILRAIYELADEKMDNFEGWDE